MSDTSTLTQVKAWLTPTLISVVGMLLWRDIGELRADVKELLTTVATNKTRIDYMEKQLQARYTIDMTPSGQENRNVPSPQHTAQLWAVSPWKDDEHDLKPTNYEPPYKN